MLTDPNEARVICEGCGQTAFQREVDVRHGTVTRRIVYQTHYQIGDDEHHKVLSRIESFHEQFHQLESDMNALPPERRKLSSGQILKFEFGSVKPSACEVRTRFIPTATVRAFGQTEEIELKACELNTQLVNGLLDEFVQAAEPVLIRLRARAESGDY